MNKQRRKELNNILRSIKRVQPVIESAIADLENVRDEE